MPYLSISELAVISILFLNSDMLFLISACKVTMKTLKTRKVFSVLMVKMTAMELKKS